MRDLMMSSSSNEGEDVVSDDVLFEIFSFLPVDSLKRLRFVCKSWFNLITSSIRNPRFAEMHTHHLYHHPSNATTTTTTDNLPTILCTSTSTCSVPYHHLYSINNSTASSSSSSTTSCKNNKIEAIEIVYPFKSLSSQLEILGSCNGLLCIRVTDYNDKCAFTYRIDPPGRMIVYTKGILCLWNPTTNEFKQVPAAPIEKPEYDYFGVINVTYGFGYDRSINNYKLVRLVGLSRSHVLEVYTLGTNSWKRVDHEIPYNLLYKSTKVGLYVDGALHWISGDSKQIYSFNVQDEEFREVPKPDCSIMVGAGLQVLRGCLCMFNSYFDTNSKHVFEMWMMMDYGEKESWTKLFRANANLGWTRMGPTGDLKPLWICKNGEVLIGSRGVQCASKHLVIYDTSKNKVIECIDIQGIPLNRTNEIVHIESLVPLKSGTYVMKTIQVKRRRGNQRKIIHRSNLLR